MWNLAQIVQKEPGKRPMPEPIFSVVLEKTYDSIIAALAMDHLLSGKEA